MGDSRCKGCGERFTASRSDAMTCSPACRQRYKRLRDKVAMEIEAAGMVECAGCGIIRRDTVRACAVCGTAQLRLC